MKKFIILDDVFDEETVAAIAAFDYGRDDRWYALGSNPHHEKILEICARHFALDGMVGYEMWRNDSNPGWHARHVDKDERLYHEKKQFAYPLCSAVYYPVVEGVVGGEFYTDDARCFPRTNRLLLFSPGTFHGVSGYSGQRISIGLNPWSRRI
ncbi:MAG: hypothetical protein FJX11_16780 [Alphaproteobacteria bacterium]|nr:hypothetical protein [Alphaproteobacteria bacterium]